MGFIIEFLKKTHEEYDITLLLFQKTGALLNEIPKDVKIIETKSAYKYLGKSQNSWGFFGRLKRGALAVLTRIFGFKFTVSFLNATVRKKEIEEDFDVAISYMHNSSYRSFYGGAVNYVLSKVHAKRKICFIHCDYLQSGTANNYNDKLYACFDKIVCVSDSVKRNFDKVLPTMSEKSVGLYNAIDVEKIEKLSKNRPYQYDKSFVNFVSVARLSSEKGLDRAILAFSQTSKKNFRYYIIGGGKQYAELQDLICANGLEKQVFLLGEQENPYCFMSGADWLVVPSYHEAAPVVYQEAKVLHLPILTTETSSAQEMVGSKFGIVVENSVEGLLQGIERAFDELETYKTSLEDYQYDEKEFLKDFDFIIND